MRQVIICALVAAAVAVVVVVVDEAIEPDPVRMDEPAGNAEASRPEAAPADPPGLRYTSELPEDVWVNGARTFGSDERSLADAANSVCFLTKVEISGIVAPTDVNRCEIGVDEFTGHWELIATVEEGGQSEVRCKARCLTWE